jgi:hypothetical protein
VRAAATAGGTPAIVVSLQGWPARRVGTGGAIVGCRVVGGAAALAIAAWTSGRHMMRLRAPGCQPLGSARLMSKAGGGKPGVLGRGGLGGRMVAPMMLLYVSGRR